MEHGITAEADRHVTGLSMRDAIKPSGRPRGLALPDDCVGARQHRARRPDSNELSFPVGHAEQAGVRAGVVLRPALPIGADENRALIAHGDEVGAPTGDVMDVRGGSGHRRSPAFAVRAGEDAALAAHRHEHGVRADEVAKAEGGPGAVKPPAAIAPRNDGAHGVDGHESRAPLGDPRQRDIGGVPGNRRPLGAVEAGENR